MKEDNHLMEKFKYVKRMNSSGSNNSNNNSLLNNSNNSIGSPIWRNSPSSPSSYFNHHHNNLIASSKSVPNIHNLNISDTDDTEDDHDDNNDVNRCNGKSGGGVSSNVVGGGGVGVLTENGNIRTGKQLKGKNDNHDHDDDDEEENNNGSSKNKLRFNDDEKNELLNGGNLFHRNREKKNPLYSSTENLGQQPNSNNRESKHIQPEAKQRQRSSKILNATADDGKSELMQMMMMLTKKRQLQEQQLQQKQFELDQKQKGKPVSEPKNLPVMRGGGGGGVGGGNNTTVTTKPPISKKRIELTKAITEARKKLETIGWKANALNTSKSVANLRDIGDNSQNNSNISKDQVTAGTPSNTSLDSVRRSISLSDLSVSTSHHRRVLQTTNSYARNIQMDKADKDAAPLWNRVKIEKPISRPHTSQHNHPMRKSYSTVALNRNSNDMSNLSHSQSPAARAVHRSLWGPPVNLMSLSPSKSTGRLSAPPTQLINKQYQLSLSRASNRRLSLDHDISDDDDDDDSTSDEEERLPIARPGTPPKPKQLNRNRRFAVNQANRDNSLSCANTGPATMFGSTRHLNGSQEKRQRKTWETNFLMQGTKSEFNLSSIGRDTPNQIRSPSSNSSCIGGSTTVDNNNYYEKIDFASANPVKIALTEDLCSTIIDELNQVATFAKKIYHRAASEGRTNLCNILVDGISKAYVSLSTVVSPTDVAAANSISPNSVASSAISPNAVSTVNASGNPENLTQTLKLLQQYSDRLLDIVEQRMASKKQ